jgi:hypothetical protein
VDLESENVQIEEELEKIKSVPPAVWHRIEEWARTTGSLTEQKKTVAFNLSGRVRNNSKISDFERQTGISILDFVIDKVPELLDGIDEINEKKVIQKNENDITLEMIKEVVKWDRKYKKLRPFEFTFMSELAEEKKLLTERNKFIAGLNLSKLKKYGFGKV